MKHHLKFRDWMDVDKIDKLGWMWLSGNTNAIHLLERNIDKIYWMSLSENPNAIDLLEMNFDKIDWKDLSTNPSIFEYDYESMTERCNIYKEELIANRFHPKNFRRFKEWGYL